MGALAGEHHVLALDRRWAPLSESVDDTVRALHALDGPPPILIGHSAGAEIAALVAARRPVGGLVLIAPVIGSGPPAIARRVAGAPVVRTVAPPLLRTGLRVGFRRALQRAWFDRSSLTRDVVDGYRRPLLEPGVAEAMWAMTAQADDVPVDWGALEDLPCCVIVGDRDRWTTPVPLRSATRHVYPGCGHLPHEEQPDRVVGDLRRFLEQVQSEHPG